LVKFTDYYGSDGRNFVDFYYLESDRTAIVVHGGGFIGGSARGKNAEKIIEYFLSKGYNVASVEYRTCKETDFSHVLKDIYEGISYTVSRVNALKHQAQFVYVGYSAGSTAAALLLMGDVNYTIDDTVKYYILLSGVYNPDNAFSPPASKTLECCREGMLDYFNYIKQPAEDIHVLLVKGTEDRYDLHPMGEESNLEFFKNLLLSAGVSDVKTMWIEGGHGVTLVIFTNDYEEEITEFLNH